MNDSPNQLNGNQDTPAINDARDQLDAWLKTVMGGFKDLLTLDVSTFTGTVSGLFTATEDSFKFQISKLGAAMQDNTVSLVAHTHVAVDMDQLLFVSDRATAEQADLLAMHNAAVKAATEARTEFVRAIAELVHIRT